jgi:lipopolysaccharide cholinephosphotransferase
MLQLAQIWQIELNLLHRFSDICKENEITFWLSNGTLLGAVKYNGFIPWDDDVDILVPRKDYDRLIRIFKDTDDMTLLSPERNQEYLYPFAKLCDNRTILEEKNYSNGVELGVNIDVFPLDNLGQDYEKGCRLVRKNKTITKWLGFSKIIQYIPNEKRNKVQIFLRRMVLICCKTVGAKRFRNLMMKNARKYEFDSNPKYVGCALWPVYIEGEVLPAEVFRKTTFVSFEGDQYPAPEGYDIYLRGLYGNYEEDPPLEKKITHHNFTAYWMK